MVPSLRPFPMTADRLFANVPEIFALSSVLPPEHTDLIETVPSRGQVLLLTLIVEGGLAVLALLLGWFFGRSPLEQFHWNERHALVGFVVSVPLFVVFVGGARLGWRPLQSTWQFLDEVAKPFLRRCTLLDLALISVLAGVGEELLFRGLLQPAMGLLLSSLIFGLAHCISTAYVFLATLIGLLLGWLLQSTGNLLTPIVTHAAYDFLALIYLLRWKQGDDSSTKPSINNGSVIESSNEIDDEPTADS